MMNFLTQLAAQLNPGDIGYEPGIKTDQDLSNTIATVTGTVYFVAAMVAVLVIVLAGYMFAMSNGNLDRTKRARFMILGAGVGLVIITLAFLLTQLVIRWVA